MESNEVVFGDDIPRLEGGGLRGDLRAGPGCDGCDSVDVVVQLGCLISGPGACVPAFNEDVELERCCDAGPDNICWEETMVIGSPKGSPKGGSGMEVL